jgi:NADH:ubiquinone oxidoreductase subunit 4 (subunit M)
MFLFNRVCFGVLNTKNIDTCYDLKFSEWAPLMILMICVFFFGIFPSVFFNFVNLDLIRISSLYDGITPVLESTTNTSLNYSTFIEIHHEKIIINTVE